MNLMMIAIVDKLFYLAIHFTAMLSFDRFKSKTFLYKQVYHQVSYEL